MNIASVFELIISPDPKNQEVGFELLQHFSKNEILEYTQSIFGDILSLAQDIDIIDVDGNVNLRNLISKKQISFKQFINNIPQQLANLPNLETVYFWGGNFDILKNDSFRGCKLLKNLYLDDCGIAEIEDNAFNGLDNIEYISLAWNKFKKVKSKTFAVLPKLHKVRFDHTRLSQIEYKQFNDKLNVQVYHCGIKDSTIKRMRKYTNVIL